MFDVSKALNWARRRLTRKSKFAKVEAEENPCSRCSQPATLCCRTCESFFCQEHKKSLCARGSASCAQLAHLKSLARAAASRALVESRGESSRFVASLEMLADSGSEDEDDACPVCLETLSPRAKAKRYFYCCSTFVCGECAKQLRRASYPDAVSCPLCRSAAPSDDASRLALLEKNVARGDAAALARVGQAYHAGRYGVGENAAAAAFFYAAAGDYAPALVNLGHAYRKGHGVPRDAARSARLFAKAAALSNHPSALNGLGYCVSDGRGCARDAALAARLFRRAADQGDADAQYNLGVLHEEGDGVDVDMASALHLWSLAAAQGHLLALEALAAESSRGRSPLERHSSPLQTFRRRLLPPRVIRRARSATL